jgi:hypothetical protein
MMGTERFYVMGECLNSSKIVLSGIEDLNLELMKSGKKRITIDFFVEFYYTLI